ncbi:hypothetical protein FSP39_021644 [Pinctada imbricata]|uniref:Uncharacterized protein n=1 Tax=Pinctada imbricata TaxID=66713 RepID=A0AA89BU45_PINIB|nr:hypothetical protein FSP39_021644 [Pinctada imbricata]
MLTGMPTYFETATVTRKSDLLAFSKGNYARLMNRKHSGQSIEKLKEMTTDRLFLYIHRTEMAVNHASLLKYLTLKLKDPESLRLLRISHRKKKGNRHLVEEHEREYFYGSYNSRRYDQHEQNIISFLKMMGVYYLSETSLPELETSTRVLTDLQKRMGDWRSRSKGMESPDHRDSPSHEKQDNGTKSYRLEVNKGY